MAKVSLRAYNREIEAMIDRGLLDEAIAHCQHILKKFPKHIETYRLLGKSYLEAKRHNEAVDIFSRVLVAEPSDFVSQVGMSIIRDDQNKLDDAIWHMERAFETQPSNAAIQGELQRLYGRRDGSQPPRIRMTRGALAHMYMQGELYPQAISETKGVLEEDQGRSDMQALLAKAYFKSGQKNDAADAASAVLKRYPFCLDANRVLTEILGSDRPESAEIYRRRVFELDPYAAQVEGSVFQSSEVSDAAVTLERLDWNGQSSGLSSDWRSTSAISLESGSPDEQPAWLKSGLPETTAPPPSVPGFVPEQEAPNLATADSPTQPPEDIPDFLRAAGWGESSGTFDESSSSTMFDDEPASEAQPLEQGDMPDWIKAMAPQEPSEPAQEEEIPDWINKIGTDELPISPVESSVDDQPDWLSQGDETETSTPEMGAVDDQLDRLKVTEEGVQAAPDTGDEAGWLSELGRDAESSPSTQLADDSDFLDSLMSGEPEQEEPIVDSPGEKRPIESDAGNLGMGEQEQDDSFAWLENLAAKQGATEGLLTDPEERLEDEPDWVKQAKGLTESEGEPAQEQFDVPESSSATIEELGKSDAERDDSFAWLENLAARQGATEGLLTKPEERLEDEPDWVKRAKSSEAAQPSVRQAIEQTMDSDHIEEALEAEIPEGDQDDIGFVESVQEAGGEFTVESMRMPQEEGEQTSEVITPSDDIAAWLDGLDTDEPVERVTSEPADDTEAWLKTLDEPQAEKVATKTESDAPADEEVGSSDELPDWLSDVDEEVSESPAVSGSDDLPSWMRDETGELVAEPTKIEPTQSKDWVPEEQKKSEAVEPPPPAVPEPVSEVKPEPAKKPAAQKKEIKPATPPEPYKEPVTRKTTGMLEMPEDPILGSARAELTRSNIPGALETYGKLIKKGRFLEEVIYDLRDALYRYPVEVSIWQSLGDAYMRANQLQDALDAYTKAEELLR